MTDATQHDGATPAFPIWDLRVRTPLIELRPIREADALALIELSDRGIHDPATMPFGIPWTRESLPDRHWNSMKHYLGGWARLSPVDWQLGFAVYADGRLVGNQDAHARNFIESRTVETGSWIGQEFQGNQFGYHARIAVLTLLIDGLGALSAETGAWHDNPRSLGVTAKVGYEPNGEWIRGREGVPTHSPRFRITPLRWAQVRPDIEVTIVGLDGAKAMLGLG